MSLMGRPGQCSFELDRKCCASLDGGVERKLHNAAVLTNVRFSGCAKLSPIGPGTPVFGEAHSTMKLIIN